MNRSLLIATVVGLVGLGFVLLNNPVMAEKDDGEKDETEIPVTQLPVPIRNALKNLKVGQIHEIERKGTGKSATYEIELKIGKDEVELTLAADGKLLGIEVESQKDDDDKDEKPAKSAKKKKRSDDCPTTLNSNQ